MNKYIAICASHIDVEERLSKIFRQFNSIINQTIPPQKIYWSVTYEPVMKNSLYCFSPTPKNIVLSIHEDVQMSQFQHFNYIINHLCCDDLKTQQILYFDDDDVCELNLAERILSVYKSPIRHVFVLDRGIQNNFCDTKCYLGIRELHGSMGHIDDLKRFCQVYQEFLHMGDLDLAFTKWLETNINVIDLFEYLYHYDQDWNNPQTWDRLPCWKETVNNKKLEKKKLDKLHSLLTTALY